MHMRLKDPSRRLPPDAQGRNRYITGPTDSRKPRVLVGVGVHHPLAGKTGYVEEGRLVMFERGELLPDCRVLYRDGDHTNTDPSNLVVWDRLGPNPLKPAPKPVPCRCGCGELIPPDKSGRQFRWWVEGHRRKRDAFSELPVSRQRQKQLRNIAHGLCSSCSTPRNGHHRYCPRCLRRWQARVNRNKEEWRQKYLLNRDKILADQVWRREDNWKKQAAYSKLYAKFGPKSKWPVGIARDWNIKYPTAGQKRLLDLGVRYDRM
jgi:hypothetical protein